jgi:hypothetical protein
MILGLVIAGFLCFCRKRLQMMLRFAADCVRNLPLYEAPSDMQARKE